MWSVRKILTPGDKVLVLVLLGLAGLSGFWTERGAKSGQTAVVAVADREVARLSLSTPRRMAIKGVPGIVTVLVQDDAVRIVDADCPLKFCVHQGAARRTRDIIICVPNKIVISIIGEKGKRETSFDGITG